MRQDGPLNSGRNPRSGTIHSCTAKLTRRQWLLAFLHYRSPFAGGIAHDLGKSRVNVDHLCKARDVIPPLHDRNHFMEQG